MKKYISRQAYRIIYVINMAVLLLIPAGCSSNKTGNNSSAPMATSVPQYLYSNESAAYDMADESEPEMYAGNSYNTAGESGDYDKSSLMFIKTAYISLNTADFDFAVDQVKSTVSHYGGYVESSNFYNNSGTQNAFKRYNATLRVPVEFYEEAKISLEGVGKLISSSESSQEVSGEYYNTQSRLETDRVEEDRLLALIDEAVDTKKLIELERRLGEVRTRIELNESKLNRLDLLTSYSTIVLDLTEVTDMEMTQQQDDSFINKLKNGFLGSIEATKAFFQNVLVFLAYIIVPLFIIGILAIAGIWINRRMKKKEKKETEEVKK